MIYLFLYVVGLALIWLVYKYGWIQSLKTVANIIVPSFLIIIFNIKAGRLLFKNPIIGILSALPSTFFIYRASKPITALVNNWIDSKFNNLDNDKDAIETESIPLDD
tara:strand:+ start:907 stop:1227 length:321 start_codon:yes stop_codon:yes gene_type:complete